MELKKKESFHSLLFLFFLIGVFSIIAQTIILREFFTILNGNEFYFGLILSIWFSGVFFGALTGRSLKKGNISCFLIPIVLMIAYMPVLIVLIRSFYFLSGTHTGSLISPGKIILIAPIIIMPFSYLIGFQFPALIDHFTKQMRSEKVRNVRKISEVYISESFGALAGGITYTFFFVERFSGFFITSLISVIILFFVYKNLPDRKLIYSMILLSFLIFFLFMLHPSINSALEKLTLDIRWNGISKSKLIYSGESKFQNISIASESGQFNQYLNGRLSGTFPDVQSNMLYASQLYVQNRDPDSILVIGNPSSGFYSSLRSYGYKKIVFTEIDKKLFYEIRKLYPGGDSSANRIYSKSVFFVDGRKYIKEIIKTNKSLKKKKDAFDIIFVNTGEPASLFLNRYYTVNFFREVSKVLGNRGTLVLKVTSSDNYKSGYFRYYTSIIYKTLKSVFPFVVMTAGEDSFIFASLNPNNVTEDWKVLESRFLESKVKPLKLRYLYKYLYDRNLINKKRLYLEQLKNIPLNTDENPIAVFYYNKLERNYRGGKSFLNFKLISILLENKEILVLSVLMLIASMVFWISIKGKRKSRFSSGFVLFATGYASIAIELIVIYLYQIFYGYIYGNIGFIISLFMLGLPLGAYLSESVIRKKGLTVFKKFAGLSLLIQILYILIVFLFLLSINTNIYNGKSGEIILYVMTILTGMSAGGIFSSNVHVLSSREKSRTFIAGFSDALDHLGAALGALIIGMVMVPLTGILFSIFFVLYLQITAVCVTFILFKFRKN